MLAFFLVFDRRCSGAGAARLALSLVFQIKRAVLRDGERRRQHRRCSCVVSSRGRSGDRSGPETRWELFEPPLGRKAGRRGSSRYDAGHAIEGGVKNRSPARRDIELDRDLRDETIDLIASWRLLWCWRPPRRPPAFCRRQSSRKKPARTARHRLQRPRLHRCLRQHVDFVSANCAWKMWRTVMASTARQTRSPA